MRSVMRVYRSPRDFSPFLLIIITSVRKAAPIAAPHGVRHRRTRSLRPRRAEAARRTAKPLRGHRVRRRDHGPGGADDGAVRATGLGGAATRKKGGPAGRALTG